jgi:hypothetical protein
VMAESVIRGADNFDSSGFRTVWQGSQGSGSITFSEDISPFKNIRISFNIGTHVASSTHNVEDVLAIGRTISAVRASPSTNSFNGGLENITGTTADIYNVDTSGFTGTLIRVEVTN